MNLFNKGNFTLHSGQQSNLKIDCDALTNTDLETLATLISDKFVFGTVFGIPRGGVALADKLKKYITTGSTTHLVVDDVLTTGTSMKPCRYDLLGHENQGVVIFARGPCPEWITPVFTLFKTK